MICSDTCSMHLCAVLFLSPSRMPFNLVGVGSVAWFLLCFVKYTRCSHNSSTAVRLICTLNTMDFSIPPSLYQLVCSALGTLLAVFGDFGFDRERASWSCHRQMYTYLMLTVFCPPGFSACLSISLASWPERTTRKAGSDH